jgi:hypothetical protein
MIMLAKISHHAAIAILWLFAFSTAAQAADIPSIAVTDLTYEQKVASYFSYVEAHAHSEQHGGGYMTPPSGSSDSSFVAASGEIIRIERGELHKFTGDIKGVLIKSGGYRVVQGRPWAQHDMVSIYDVIDRIKQGYYAGADYVLFGTITSIESRNEAFPIQATTATNYILSMELLAEFSLINTKTYEVMAGFSAIGEGNDSRLVNSPGTTIHLSSGRVMRDVALSLADNVLSEVTTQFSPAATSAHGRGNTGGANGNFPSGTNDNSPSGKITIYH